MALLSIFLANPLDAAGNTAALVAAMALATEGVRIEYSGATPARFRANGGYVVGVPANRTLAGVEVVPGSAPATKLALTETDGAGGTVVTGTLGACTNVIVRDLQIDGGRSIGGWGTQTGACVAMAGQQDYPGGASRHGVQIINCYLFDGFTQQTSILSVNGFEVRGVKTWATANPTVSAHGGDHDAVAVDKPAKNGLIVGCDLDAYGQECLKFENATDILIDSCVIRMYATFTQDIAACASEVGRITFRRCTIDAAIIIGNLKRRHIPGSGANTRKATDVLTVSAAGVIGGTITATSTPTAFVAGDVGKSVGCYSGFGTGFGIIESVTTGTATIRVYDVFANNDGTPLVYEANEWVLGYCDNGGDGSLTFERNTFTVNGLIWPQDATAANYGTQTITDNYFDPRGNSYKYPAGVAPVASGNAFDNGPLRRFVRPSAPKYTLGGGTGISGLNEACARANAGSSINTAIGYAQAGDEVVCVDGLYTAAAGGANRGINLGGKAITLRAESAYGAVVDLSGGSSWQGIASSADVAGALVWGLVFYGAGKGGGNGIGISLTGTTALTLRKVAMLGCVTANNGAGFKSTSTGAWTMEDYWIEGCDGGATVAGLYNVATPAGAAPVLRRGVIRGCTTSGAGVGAAGRISCAGTVIEGLEVSGNAGTGATAIAGLAITTSCSITNLTAAGNASGASAVANDVSIGNNITVTGDSWICRSTANGLKPLANGATASVITLSNSNIVGWDGTNASVCNGTPALLNLSTISANDPLFVDPIGGNYQLQPGSPARGAGVLHAGAYDAFNRPLAVANQGAWA